VAKKVARKRYAAAEALLARLVEFAEGPLPNRESVWRLFGAVLASSPFLVADAARGESVEVTRAGPGKVVDRWDAVAVQNTLRKFFGGVVDLGRREVRSAPVPRIRIGELTFGGLPDGTGSIVIAVSGSTENLLMYCVVQLLERAGIGRLRRCPAANCERIFTRVGRREFCSDRCQKRMYMRGLRREQRLEKKRRGGHGNTKTRTP
jgi:hypothetical protein